MKIKLGEALRYEQPTKYIVASEKYNDSYATPVLTAGKSFILGYTNEESGIYDNLPVIIFDDFTTDIKYVDFPFKVKSSAMKMLQPANENYNLKFFYYLIKYMNFQPTSHQRHWISKFAEMEFDIPERVKQDQIVEKLDKLVEMQSKKTTQLKKYDDLVKSQFIEMFETLECPVKTIGDVCLLKSGKTFDSSLEQENGEFMYAKVSDMNLYGNEKFMLTSNKFVNKQTAGKNLISIGAVIFPKRGGAIGTNKKRVVIKEMCVDLNIMAVIPQEEITTEYLYQYFLNIDMESLSNGANVPQINNKDIAPLKIKVPPKELQNKFAEIVKHIDKLKYNDVLMEVA